MTQHRYILEEGESLSKPFVGSLVLHAALFGSVFLFTAFGVGKRETLGDPSGGAYGVAIQPVTSINLPPRSGPRNPVANDSESEVPEAPSKVAKKAPEPDREAVALPSKNKKDRRARERETRQQAKDLEPPRPNQVYGNVPQSISSPLYGGTAGGGGVGIGNNSPFGSRFGWYAQAIREKVQSKWRSDQLDPRLSGAPEAVVTFTILRDGSSRNVKIVQSSGNYSVDTSAQRAILEASPFPPLPPASTATRPTSNSDSGSSDEKTSLVLSVERSGGRAGRHRAGSEAGDRRRPAAGDRHPRFPGRGRCPEVHGRFQPDAATGGRRRGCLQNSLEEHVPAPGAATAVGFQGSAAPQNVRRGQRAEPVRQGPWLTDWSEPPLSANYLAFGYTASQGDRLILSGWLYNVNQSDLGAAQAIGKVYVGTLDAAGARKVAQEFAADILKLFGAQSLMGTKIYFVSARTGNKEIWGMDYDGGNQRQITRYSSISTYPALSADGTRIAFTSWLRGQPEIILWSLESNRRLPFYNPHASANGTPEFTPDGRRILFASSLTGYTQIYVADLDGKNLQRLTNVRAVEVSPKVNPKTGAEMVFVSGRSGPAQIYRMNMDGADLVRLTPGEGEAANPAWHPDGKLIAFAWTRGFAPGNFNIFVMDVATQQYVQLTHGQGRNENPCWAPDGKHLVFSSNRNGGTQIYTMLADGTDVRQLTSAGVNEKPIWGK